MEGLFSCRPLPKRGQTCDIPAPPPQSLNNSSRIDNLTRLIFTLSICDYTFIHGGHKTAEERDVQRTDWGRGLRGEVGKQVIGLSPGQPHSFRYERRLVDSG